MRGKENNGFEQEDGKHWNENTFIQGLWQRKLSVEGLLTILKLGVITQKEGQRDKPV